MHTIRLSVTENRLSNPDLVKHVHYEEMINMHGRGWVYEEKGNILGFAFLDITNKNVWALFVSPAHEKKGIGRALHDHLLTWWFKNYAYPLWLSTSPDTRAEKFYRRAGWRAAGRTSSGEIRFEKAIFLNT